MQPNLLLKAINSKHLSFFSVGVRSKGSGRMEKDTDLELKRGVVGYIGANGRRVLRGDMECANQILQQPSTKVPGPMDCKTVTDRRHMRMKVKL